MGESCGEDGTGLASVYMACRGALARVVGRIVKRHDIEDILQDAFIRSFEAGGRYHIRNPRAFLLRTATNLALEPCLAFGLPHDGGHGGSGRVRGLCHEQRSVETTVDAETVSRSSAASSAVCLNSAGAPSS